jgi:hypothetical protein
MEKADMENRYAKGIWKADMRRGIWRDEKSPDDLVWIIRAWGYYLPTPNERQSFSSQSSSSSSASTKQALQRLLGFVNGSFLPQMQTILTCLPSM